MTPSPRLLEMIDQLPEKRRRIVWLHYGLDGGPGRRLPDIAQQLGLETERAKRWLVEALNDLDQASREELTDIAAALPPAPLPPPPAAKRGLGGALFAPRLRSRGS